MRKIIPELFGEGEISDIFHLRRHVARPDPAPAAAAGDLPAVLPGGPAGARALSGCTLGGVRGPSALPRLITPLSADVRPIGPSRLFL